MKARTKLERRVLELGDRLPALSKAKREWAFSLFPAYGFYLKKRRSVVPVLRVS